MNGDSSVQPQYSTDALGNLIPLAPGSPFITNSGDQIGAGGNVTQTGAGALLDSIIPGLPWYAWAALGVLGFVIVRDILR